MNIDSAPTQESFNNSIECVQFHILCLLILAISTLCFLVPIFYQLLSSQNFWDSPILAFGVAGIAGYVVVFGLILNSVRKFGSSQILFNWPFIGFLVVLLNGIVFSIPGLGMNVVGTIIGELIVGVIGYLAYETYTKRKKIS